MPTAASLRLEARLPTPRAPRARGAPAQPSLAQFVFLSILIHALFILLFGSPAGGSPEGQAMWGSLEVRIRGPLLDEGIGLKLDRGEASRLAGARMPSPQEETREAPAPPEAVPPPAPARPPPDMDAATQADLVPAPPAMQVTPAPPVVTDLKPAPKLESLAPRIPDAEVPLLEFSPRPAASPRLAPAVALPPVKRPPAKLPAIATPLLAPAAPLESLPTLAQPVELARPAPVELPPAATRLLAPVAPPAALPGLAPPVELARPAPVELPPEATRLLSSPAPVTASPALDSAVKIERPAPAAPSAARDREAIPSTAAPSRDSPIFINRKPPPPTAAAPGTGPRIDLEAARARAREVAREGTGNRALLPFPMPPAPERKTKEQLAIEKAWKPDCKDAYKDLGLLAVVPLIANEFGEGSCRW